MSAPVSTPVSAMSPRKLRIAVLNRTFSPTGGGAERYSIALVEQLADRHEIHVFAQDIDHHWPGVSYHRVSAPLRKPRWINQLWFATATWWATRHGFDVVHSHENTWHGQVQTVHVLPVKYNLFKGRTGGRLLLRWLKVVSSPRLLTYLLLERQRYALRPGRQLVVTSESLRGLMTQTYPCSSDKLSVITPGITLPPFITPEHQRAAREFLGLPAKGQCVLFVANDYRKKGLNALLDALAQLPESIFLAVVGNAGHISLFLEQVNFLKLEQRVFFLGSLKDVKQAYEAADCLAHPTLEDTFAMVVLEAMAHKLPVIVSDAKYCGISGLLTHGINASILKDPRDVPALVSSLVAVFSQPGYATQLSQGASNFALKYQWCEIALQQEELYFRVHNQNLMVKAPGINPP